MTEIATTITSNTKQGEQEMSKLEEYKKKAAELLQQAESIGREGIAEEFAGIFARFPFIEAVVWRQYTPYFNDGDPCVFVVWEASIKIEGHEEPKEAWDIKWETQNGAVFPEMAAVSVIEANTVLRGIPDDLLLNVLGDHAEVTIFRDGAVSAAECSHE